MPAKKLGITLQTYYRWRKEFGGLKIDQARRLKELELENQRLKKIEAELALDKSVLKEINKGIFEEVARKFFKNPGTI